jgi:hypothetical protein
VQQVTSALTPGSDDAKVLKQQGGKAVFSPKVFMRLASVGDKCTCVAAPNHFGKDMSVPVYFTLEKTAGRTYLTQFLNPSDKSSGLFSLLLDKKEVKLMSITEGGSKAELSTVLCTSQSNRELEEALRNGANFYKRYTSSS